MIDAELRRILEAARSDNSLPAVTAAVGRAGEALWAGTTGHADVESQTGPTERHQFRVASITKLFTATVVMQLRDEDALALSDPVGRHLPEVEHLPVTIADALCHRGALLREVPGDVWATLEFPSADDFLAGLDDVLIDSKPAWHYSNIGYVLVGLIAARLRDMPFDDVVRERVIEPLGLERTGFAPTDPFAKGYLRHLWADELEHETPVVLGDTAPQGGIWSTPSELTRFASSVLTGERSDILSPAAAADMCRMRVMLDRDGWGMGWGLGPAQLRRGDRIYIGHGGAIPGFSSGLCLHRASGLAAAAQCNARGATAAMGDLAMDLIDAAERQLESAPPAPPAWIGAPGDLDGALGEWWLAGEPLTLRWRDGGLTIAEGDETTRLEREGRDSYRAVDGGWRGERLSIARDDDGRCERLTLAGRPLSRRVVPAGEPALARAA